MKIAIQCKSLLLQRSLEIFLQEYLSTYKQADLIIRDTKVQDTKKSLYIASDSDADLLKPFSKAQLLLTIDNILKKTSSKTKKIPQEEKKSFSVLEQKIDKLTTKFKQELLQTIKEHYEN